MGSSDEEPLKLPSAEDVRRAVRLYLANAYDGDVAELADRFLPSPDADMAEWLMSEVTERDPPDAPLDAVRIFSLRIGNKHYPNMKLRLSRPPDERALLFSVDSHDAFLRAPPGSPDFAALEDLKRGNAEIAAAIGRAWHDAGVLTERNWLREKIRQAKQRRGRRQP